MAITTVPRLIRQRVVKLLSDSLDQIHTAQQEVARSVSTAISAIDELLLLSAAGLELSDSDQASLQHVKQDLRKAAQKPDNDPVTTFVETKWDCELLLFAVDPENPVFDQL